MGCRFSQVLTCGGKCTSDDSGDCVRSGLCGSAAVLGREELQQRWQGIRVHGQMVKQAQNGCKKAGDPYCVCDACHKGATCDEEDRLRQRYMPAARFHSARCCASGWYQKDPNDVLSKCDEDTISACNRVVNTCIKRCDVDDVVVPCRNDKACRDLLGKM